MDSEIQSSIKSSHRPLGMVDKDESMLCEIHRHPYGLIVLYISSLFGVVAAVVMILFVLPSIIVLDSNSLMIVTMLVLATGVMVALGLLIATVVYRQSKLIVTDKNITQILQMSLFNRKISQLSMANVEDVTAEQTNFLQHLFNFGTLKVETAGEQMNFHFIYCPQPTLVAKEILEAREKYIEHPSENGNMPRNR